MTPETKLKRRRSDYVDTFSSPQGERVLADLHEFCGASKSSFGRNPYETAHNEGMRRVWLRIEAFLRMDDERILRILKKAEE